MTPPDIDQLGSLLGNRKLGLIASALLKAAQCSAVLDEFPMAEAHIKRIVSAVTSGDPEEVERELLRLYAFMHGAGAAYSREERHILEERGGYSCLAGGFAPLLAAEPFLSPGTVLADLGAGNGLQGLLLQRLYPHRKTLQIELSKSLIKTGRLLQRALEVPEDRVQWVNEDILNADLSEVGFIYLYRPARPTGKGRCFYKTLAEKLRATPGPLVIFSIADCLGQFLSDKFIRGFSDGHLTCFLRDRSEASPFLEKTLLEGIK